MCFSSRFAGYPGIVPVIQYYKVREEMSFCPYIITFNPSAYKSWLSVEIITTTQGFVNKSCPEVPSSPDNHSMQA